MLSGVCILFPGLMAVWMLFIPRSPIFLVTRNDVEGARKSLKWFRGGSSKNVDAELEAIQKMVEERNKIKSVSPKALFTEAQYVKPLSILMVTMFLQQASGINYVVGYSSTIFQVRFRSLV